MKARQCAFEAAKCEVCVVSGKALGIDSIVFDETLKYGGKTIAIYPQLTWQILNDVRAGVLAISEYPPTMDIPPNKWQFIARNRLLAALSPYTIVIEAPLRSGTLTTVDLALAYNRSVYVVLPDSNHDSSYGGIAFAMQESFGVFIQSLYDVWYRENCTELLEKYKDMLRHISCGKITVSNKDSRHLATADLRRILLKTAGGDLSLFESAVIELQRFGIIRERKNKVVVNFSGYNSWPKI